MSALDVSVRGQVLDLLLEVQEEMGLAYLFISHDMAVVERMSHDVAVMRGGEFVEYGTPTTRVRGPGPGLHKGADEGRSDSRSTPRSDGFRTVAGRRGMTS